MMRNRSKITNRLALMLLSIIVLELVLIGDRVQPVKKIKKKFYLKKFKRLFPLPSLIKPKKKFILIPIPIPIIKNFSNKHRPIQPFNQSPNNVRPGPLVPPTMMGTRPTSPLDGSSPSMSMTMVPMSMLAVDNNIDLFSMPNFDAAPTPPPVALNTSNAQPLSPMIIPSMTMSIQPGSSGSPAIELSMTSSRLPNTSAPLIQSPYNHNKWQPQQQQQHYENFDDPAEQLESEQYFISTRPLASPAKVSNERLRANREALSNQQPPTTARKPRYQRHAILIVRNQKRQAAPRQSGVL